MKRSELNYWPSFVDVITSIFLVLFFMLMIFLIKNYADTKRVKELEEIVGKVENDLNYLENLFNDEKLEINNGEIRIILGEDSEVTFPINSANVNTISINGKKRLRKIGNYLAEFLQNRNESFGIVIEGYTDTEAGEDYNYNLSFNRAKNMMHFLEKESGLTPDKYDISPVGFGELQSRLKIKTTDQVKEKLNRRIEIRIVPKFGTLFTSYLN